MAFSLNFTLEAAEQLKKLEKDGTKLKKVRKTLGLMERDPHHSGLKSHRYDGLSGPNDEVVWESYVENNVPAAFRVFWCYGPDKSMLTIIAITKHP
jgi:hypothetical protein